MASSISIGRARILCGWSPSVMASNRRTSSHDGPSGNDACEKTRGARMDRRQSFTAPAPCFRKTEESPQCSGKGSDRRPRVTFWFEHLLKRHVDPTEE